MLLQPLLGIAVLVALLILKTAPSIAIQIGGIGTLAPARGAALLIG